MKTKTLALLEIAIVLCSVFLVALPAIAANQSQTTQKASANAITTTVASENLALPGQQVYGDANEDDVIDMRDVTYIKLAIFGKKPKTDLADANYDGKVSMLDVGQTKLIILGKEKKLTFIDIFGEAVTVNKPIKRLVNLGGSGLQVARMINAMDILLPVVGWDRSTQPIFYPEFSKWSVVGMWNVPDIEAIINLKPDAVLTYGATPSLEVEDKLKTVNIQMIRLNFYSEIAPQSLEKLGYILDKKEEAKEYSDYANKYIDIIKSKTKGLSDDKKPKVFLESWYPYFTQPIGNDSTDLAIRYAGGRNIAASYPGRQLTPEWVIEQNPDIILKYTSSSYAGYAITDVSKLIAMRDEIMSRPELANVNAVKNGEVYIFCTELMYLRGFIGISYMAKWFHPELFEDLDPEAINKEYLERFLDMPYRGVYVYPPLAS